MAPQKETTRIANPFKAYLNYMGWNCENTHGNQYQEGFPDCYIMHTKYAPRWVEFKVIDNGTVHLTPAQLKKFPIWIGHGVGIWIIKGHDFRSTGGKSEMIKEYNQLFKAANAAHYLTPEGRRLLI